MLSASLLFLVGGAVVSDGFLGLIHITADSPIVAVTADLALFAVLFTDGMHVSFPKLRENWKNPARALGLGMPLAVAGMALSTHYLVGLDWTTSFLVGAVLAPTDPVFASATVGRKEVPAKLRQLLNVESGINEGRPERRAADPSPRAGSAGRPSTHDPPRVRSLIAGIGRRPAAGGRR